MDADIILTRLAGLADAAELSASISANGTERRVLFFLDLTAEAVGLMAAAARTLRLPDSLLAAWQQALPGADAVCIALREDRRSVRLYVQYWDRLVDRLESGAATLGPLYLGFKALPDGSVRIDHYEALPELAKDVFWPPMARALDGLGIPPAARDAAFAPLSAQTAIVTRTDAPGRSSWLVTVRRAGLQRAKVARAFSQMDPLPGLDDLIDGLAHSDLVHLAGGHDALKGDFTTIYRGCDPAEALARLMAHPPPSGS
jgi:hypothetical protein